jgi:adenine-specific DNA-methyltransferase
MRDRIAVLHRLLRVDGCFLVGHYLKIICDEIFGRKYFIATFLWKKIDSPNDNKVPVTPDHEFIFAYAKSIDDAKLRQRPDSSLLEAYQDQTKMVAIFVIDS